MDRVNVYLVSFLSQTEIASKTPLTAMASSCPNLHSSLVLDVGLQLSQSLRRGIQGLVRLTERKPGKVLCQGLVWFRVEFRRGDRTDANLLRHPVTGPEILGTTVQQLWEFVILGHLNLVRVHQDEIGSLRNRAGQT